MNTTSKASNAFEAFFGIHELPPPPSPSTSPLPLPLPLPPPRVLSTTLKARKLHWRNPMANIGIDIIGIRISQQRHGEHNTDGNTHVTSRSHGSVLPSSQDSRPSVAAAKESWDPQSSLPIHTPCTPERYTRVTIVHATLSIVAAGVPSLRGRIRP